VLVRGIEIKIQGLGVKLQPKVSGAFTNEPPTLMTRVNVSRGSNKARLPKIISQ
jgi:hypothetical protein